MPQTPTQTSPLKVGDVVRVVYQSSVLTDVTVTSIGEPLGGHEEYRFCGLANPEGHAIVSLFRRDIYLPSETAELIARLQLDRDMLSLIIANLIDEPTTRAK